MPSRIMLLSLCLASCIAGCREAPTNVTSVLATGQQVPQSLVLDDTSVYWVNAKDGSVMKVAKSGGAPVTLATDQSMAGTLALDAKSVFWTTGDHVLSVPKDGGEPKTLTDWEDDPLALTTDGVNLYWLDYGDGTTRMLPINGTEATTLATWPRGTGTSLVVDQQNLYWTLLGSADQNFTDGSVVKMPIAGGEVVVLAAGQSHPSNLVLHGGKLFWLSGNSLMSVATSGGTPASVAFAFNQILAIAADDGFLYWSTFVPQSGAGMTSVGNIWTSALSGGGRGSLLVSGLESPDSIAVDATSIYWTDSGAGTVGKYTFR